MRRVVIRVSSPNYPSEQARNSTHISAMKELSNGSGELKIDKDEQRAVSPTKIENHSAKIQTTESGDVTSELTQNKLNELNSSQGSFLIQNADRNVLQMLCKNCNQDVDVGEIESTLNANRKELEARKLEVEEIKTKLEDELFERLRIEEDFSSERELLEREISSLRERIEELEGEATWKIEDLENDFKVLTTKYENAKEEISHLKVMLERTVSENVKLRNNESATDDRVMEIIDELELWKRKAQEFAERGDTSRSFLQTEIEMYEKEIQSLKETLMETSLSNDTRGRRLSELENNVNYNDNSQDKNIDDFGDSIDGDSAQNTIRTGNKVLSSSEKHVVELCSELSELYRDNSSYQDKFISLYEGLRAKEKELEDVRGEYESQNIEVQNYKEKYAELKDVILATCQDNTHLRNRLEEKAKDYTELKKKSLVSETEVIWLREALGLIKTPTA